jgi:hypothetical protein
MVLNWIPTDTETLTGKQLYDHYNESLLRLLTLRRNNYKLGLEEDGTVKEWS